MFFVSFYVPNNESAEKYCKWDQTSWIFRTDLNIRICVFADLNLFYMEEIKYIVVQQMKDHESMKLKEVKN